MGVRISAQTMRGFHLPPITRVAKATGQGEGATAMDRCANMTTVLASCRRKRDVAGSAAARPPICKETPVRGICVTPERELEVRDAPEPHVPPPGHLVVRIEAAAVNYGDKTFLKRPEAAGPALARSGHDVWGASAAGEVVAAGSGVPGDYVGRVAICRSIGRGPDTVGLWCERAQVPGPPACACPRAHTRATTAAP